MNALIIVDMQVGCYAGEPPRHDGAALVERITGMADAFRASGMVVHIQHTDSDIGFERGSPAWQFLPGIVVDAADHIVEKSACDAFMETGLEALLDSHDVEDVTIVGCATDFCVDTTIRAAASRGYRVTAVSDGHTTRDRPHLKAVDIITHHNYMWENLQLPRQGRVRVVTMAELMKGL
jgi:nicotinamidase-related amidase